MYLYWLRFVHAPSRHGDFCTHCIAMVMQISARMIRTGVQNRAPDPLRGARTACSPSGPPMASDMPPTRRSEWAGSSFSVGAAGGIRTRYPLRRHRSPLLLHLDIPAALAAG